jgi:hypothetical protein
MSLSGKSLPLDGQKGNARAKQVGFHLHMLSRGNTSLPARWLSMIAPCNFLLFLCFVQQLFRVFFFFSTPVAAAATTTHVVCFGGVWDCGLEWKKLWFTTTLMMSVLEGDVHLLCHPITSSSSVSQ